MRRMFAALLLALGLLVAPFAAGTQPAARIPRIGVRSPAPIAAASNSPSACNSSPCRCGVPQTSMPPSRPPAASGPARCYS